MSKILNYGKIASVCLELTDYCIIGCPYCLLEEKTKELSPQKMIEIVKKLDEYGVKRFTIGGGEPLVVSYLFEISSIIKTLGHKSLLRTTGCMYMDCDLIKRNFDIVDISIDSCKEETLKLCKPNLFPQIVFENIRNLIKNNIRCRCNILLTQYNYCDVLTTVDWMIKNGVKEIRVQKLVPRGRAKDIFSKINITNEMYSYKLKEIRQECNRFDVDLKEVKSVNSNTLCIIKPNGQLYTGNPNGLERIGDVFNVNCFNKAVEKVFESQKEIYNSYYDD